MKITLFVSNPFMIMFILFNSFRQCNRLQKIGSICVLNFHYTANDPILQGKV